MIDNLSVLGPDGMLSSRLADYESRPLQVKMADLITHALESKRHAAIEAGTGTGKSFGYLVPTVLWAARHHKRVVVSTRTKALQEQLVRKDIPLLREVLSGVAPFEAVLVKGRANYLCMRKIRQAESEPVEGLFDDEDSSAEELDVWQRFLQWYHGREGPVAGDLEEVPMRVEASLWERISCNEDDCPGRECDFFEECFFYVARRRQSSAHVLVANHALLMADLAVRMDSDGDAAVLHDFDAVVLDEAHSLEDVASGFFGLRVSHGRVTSLAKNVRRAFKALRGRGAGDDAALNDITPIVEALTQASRTFFEGLAEQQTTVIDGPLNEPLSDLLQALAARVEHWIGSAGSSDAHLAMAAVSRQVMRLAADIAAITRTARSEDMVFWAERDRQLGVLRAAPIEVAEPLREHLFERAGTVVLTSATLSFDLLPRIGLEYPLTLQVESPFNFAEQALLYVPADAPGYRDDQFAAFTHSRIHSLVSASQGRALILFTSYAAMAAAHTALAAKLRHLGIEPLMQGQQSNSVLAGMMRAGGNRALFATSSFWEGIDIPGAALSLVILAKLPFDVPTHPLVKAKSATIKRAGGNPFEDLALPQAITRLKQGFGRLIRTTSDRGVVAILDGRIRTKSYGERILDALPPSARTGSLEAACNFLRTAIGQRVQTRCDLSSRSGVHQS